MSYKKQIGKIQAFWSHAKQTELCETEKSKAFILLQEKPQMEKMGMPLI